MATIERVRFVPHGVSCINGTVRYNAKENRQVIDGLPQIFWADNTPWREANVWAAERATSDGLSIKTIASNMNGLLNYAKFLEAENIHWFQFPARKSERCLVLYRGALIRLRDAGVIMPATATEYMRVVVMFYRWIRQKDLIGAHVKLWSERDFFAAYFDEIGFERTVRGITTDLAIPNRKRIGLVLEDGLIPVSSSDRDAILGFAGTAATTELYLMLAIGFFTGMRLGSICDLKIQSLIQALPDPLAPGLLKLHIGPGATPPVETKFSVTGTVWIPLALCQELLEYAGSLHRAKREARALIEDRDLLFLTRFGNSYGRRESNKSSAINVEMSLLRRKAALEGFKVMQKFRFHQTRCTFGTELARLALSACDDAALVVAIVSNALLHAPNSEAVTFRYIRFVQTLPIKQALSHKFMLAFTGINSGAMSYEKS